MIGYLALAGALYMIVTDLRATWRPMEIITVPDIPHDTLCYKQKFDPPGAMGRCDRPKGHLGPHSYALADCLRDLETFITAMRAAAREERHAKTDRVLSEWADRLATALKPYRDMIR